MASTPKRVQSITISDFTAFNKTDYSGFTSETLNKSSLYFIIYVLYRYWSTLLYNTQFFPDSGLIFKSEWQNIKPLSRFVGWGYEGGENFYECKGASRHFICIFSIEDLPELIEKPFFIANKFRLDYDPIAYQCMEEWYDQRSQSSQIIDMNFYCKFKSEHSNLTKCHKPIYNPYNIRKF